MEKIATISKIGYSAGVYGCSNEYFIVCYVENNIIKQLFVKGLYGEEYRAVHELERLGYKVSWGASVTPQFKGEDRKRIERLAVYANQIEEYMK